MKKCPHCFRAYNGNHCAKCAGKRIFVAKLRNSYRWKETSVRLRTKHPTCQECGEKMSEEVHHIKSAEDRPDLFFAESNLEALCGGCHKRRHE